VGNAGRSKELMSKLSGGKRLPTYEAYMHFHYSSTPTIAYDWQRWVLDGTVVE